MNRRDFIGVWSAALAAVVLPTPKEEEFSLEGLTFIPDPDPIRGFLAPDGRFIQVQRWLNCVGGGIVQNPEWVAAPQEIRVAMKDGEVACCVAFPSPIALNL